MNYIPAVILTLIVLALIYMRIEAGLLQVKKVRFGKGKNCLKIIQLSDIHIGLLKVSWYKVKAALDRENPDLVIISGDFIEKREQEPDFLRFLSYIKGNHKIYLCLGNHDYEAFKSDIKGLEQYTGAIEKKGAIVLHNQSVILEKNNKKYNLIGIGDFRTSNHDIDKAFSSCENEAFANIAFSHNPDIALNIPKGKVDYLFCGHFHGGQIWAPFDLEFKILRADKLCKMGVKRGLHKVNGINLYINKGLGNVCVPLRFMSKPEITVFYMP